MKNNFKSFFCILALASTTLLTLPNADAARVYVDRFECGSEFQAKAAVNQREVYHEFTSATCAATTNTVSPWLSTNGSSSDVIPGGLRSLQATVMRGYGSHFALAKSVPNFVGTTPYGYFMGDPSGQSYDSYQLSWTFPKTSVVQSGNLYISVKSSQIGALGISVELGNGAWPTIGNSILMHSIPSTAANDTPYTVVIPLSSFRKTKWGAILPAPTWLTSLKIGFTLNGVPDMKVMSVSFDAPLPAGATRTTRTAQ